MEKSDEFYFDLLSQAKSGDRHAKNELFTVCEPFVLAASVVGGKHDEELFSYLEMAYILCVLRSRSTSWKMFLAYLRKTLYYEKKNYFTKELKKMQEFVHNQVSLNEDVLYENVSRDNDVLSDVLDAISSSLTQVEKELVFLRSIQDMSFADIGEKLHISADLARAKYHYALKKTRKRLNRPP